MGKPRLLGAVCAAAVLCGVTLMASPSRAALSEDNFQARTSDDLVALCSAPSTDPLYTAAQNFCHGFALGTYQVIHEIQMADPRIRLFCLPDPPPSRNAAITDYVAWVQAHPDRGSAAPAETIAAFLNDRYPCPKVAAPARTKSRRTTP